MTTPAAASLGERLRILEHALRAYPMDDEYRLTYVLPALGEKPCGWSDDEFAEAQLWLYGEAMTTRQGAA